MHLVGSSIYTACVSDLVRPYTGDKLFRWDLDSDSVVELELLNFPGGEDAENRSFHGLDVNVLPNGTVAIYAINHLRDSSVIDKFIHTPDAAYAEHVLRITTDSEDAPRMPSDIFALPERDGDAAMFVTNDHYHASGWQRKLEEATRRPWTWVSYYSRSTGWKKVLVGLAGATGITGDKDPQGRRVYVSETFNGAIRVLEPIGQDGELKEIQRVRVEMLAHNVARSGDDLYIAGPAKGAAVHSFEENPEMADGPGMVVKRINTKQLGGDFFGGGYTADPIVETLIMDGGRLGNMTTTALFRPYVVEAPAQSEGEDDDEDVVVEKALVGKPRGDLFITGPEHEGKSITKYRQGNEAAYSKFTGIMRCLNFE
jgi:hypothetical protein